jgi:hypothetical protein
MLYVHVQCITFFFLYTLHKKREPKGAWHKSSLYLILRGGQKNNQELCANGYFSFICVYPSVRVDCHWSICFPHLSVMIATDLFASYICIHQWWMSRSSAALLSVNYIYHWSIFCLSMCQWWLLLICQFAVYPSVTDWSAAYPSASDDCHWFICCLCICQWWLSLIYLLHIYLSRINLLPFHLSVICLLPIRVRGQETDQPVGSAPALIAADTVWLHNWVIAPLNIYRHNSLHKSYHVTG